MTRVPRRTAAGKAEATDQFNINVFINCPFDAGYLRFFKAIIFTVHYLGFIPRSALESANANETRIAKIKRIISECGFGLHDISRVGTPPRFNMPFELGVDIGACEFGGERFQHKSLLILDTVPYRFHRTISDISGQDPSIYQASTQGIITAVRNWLHQYVNTLPVGASDITKAFRSFTLAEPKLRKKLRLDDGTDFNFRDFSALVRIWLEETR